MSKGSRKRREKEKVGESDIERSRKIEAEKEETEVNK